MSFFGFDTTRHNAKAPGFSQAHDPFAGLSRGEDDDALEFEDTYDGLGDQLEETGDAFNDDTFGGSGGGGVTGGVSSSSVGKDFDFFGQTAKVANAMEEEHLRYNRQKPAPKASSISSASVAPAPSYFPSQPVAKPARSGYEKYKDPEPVPDLHVDASLWGMPAKKPAPAPAAVAPAPTATGRKVMSLEEVEASMRAQSSKPTQSQSTDHAHAPQQQTVEHPDFLYAIPAQPQARRTEEQQRQPQGATQSHLGHGHPVTILQRPQSIGSKHTPPVPTESSPSQQQAQHAQIHPTQILQNPHRLSGDAARIGASHQHPGHRTQGSQSGISPMYPHTSQHPQMAQLSEQEKSAYLDQETKRAKRNHKIWLLSKDNGLMTPQDKNFVTRIQLQQLVAATGNPIEHGTDSVLSEDFYYQVHSQIRGGHRQNPSQPLNNFAQTYLFQTGSRQGGLRRQGRVAENHVQRMEQQVQRAVEAAKNKPKNPQLVIAGSLGKISFSNAKTPKPLLNIRRPDNSESPHPPTARREDGSAAVLNRKAILRNIERVYDVLMAMEDHSRSMPPPSAQGDSELQDNQKEWLDGAQELNEKLWESLKVLDPIGETSIHPFIAFLAHSKGKKAIPRVFRHISFEQRTAVLTLIILHLDQLDVVRGAQINGEEMGLNAAMRENIELFSVAVMPSLFAYFNETGLEIVTGVLGLILKLNIDLIAKTRIGTSMLTLVLSRAELLKQGGGGNPQFWAEW
jgi:DNA topoisomerase 2-associated protein PAT1